MDAGREAKHTPGAMHPWAPKGWMWTPQQWAEIVDRSRKAVACRQKARIDRNEARHFDSRHWLMRDARSAEKEARTHERRVHSLVRCWLPEVLS